MDCAMDNTSNYFCKGLTFQQITIFESYAMYWLLAFLSNLHAFSLKVNAFKKQNNHIDLYLKYQMN